MTVTLAATLALVVVTDSRAWLAIPRRDQRHSRPFHHDSTIMGRSAFGQEV